MSDTVKARSLAQLLRQTLPSSVKSDAAGVWLGQLRELVTLLRAEESSPALVRVMDVLRMEAECGLRGSPSTQRETLVAALSDVLALLAERVPAVTSPAPTRRMRTPELPRSTE